MKLLLTGILCCALVLGGCGYREQVVIKDEASYLRFVGDPEQVTVSVDQAAPIRLREMPVPPVTEEHQTSAANSRIYRVAPGKHRVQAYRDGRLIVDRILFLGSQQIMEVTIQ